MARPRKNTEEPTVAESTETVEVAEGAEGATPTRVRRSAAERATAKVVAAKRKLAKLKAKRAEAEELDEKISHQERLLAHYETNPDYVPSEGEDEAGDVEDDDDL